MILKVQFLLLLHMQHLFHHVFTFDESLYPSLISDDGNLIIRPGKNRNITLSVNQMTSFVNIENMNLVHLLTSAQKSIDKVQVLEESMKTIRGPEVDDLQRMMSGRNGILKRLNRLEIRANNTNLSINRRTTNQIRNKLRRLTTKVRSIEILLNKNECQSTPCKNGGTCIDNYNSFWCLCPKNWEGSDCSTDVDECLHFSHTGLGCQNGATCINQLGSYKCNCANGWYGIHCSQRSMECGGSDSELCGHGVCRKKTDGSGINCICDQGWTKDRDSPACTTDINECTSSRYPCSTNPHVPCINVPGSFACGFCPTGYTGDGFQCIDVDECVTNNGGCSTTPLVRCINTMGSRICGSCPPGYVGDGVTCEYKGVCTINNGGCHPLAICTENPIVSTMVVRCTCRPGYTGSGYGENGCIQSSQSVNPTELRSIHCNSNPCVHGRCFDTQSGHMCLCDPGYTGNSCESANDPCEPKPCQNGGTCIKDANETSGFRCQCTTQFTGATCSSLAKQCARLIEAEEGTLTYPETNSTKYGHNSKCVWIIRTKADKILNVTFSKFNLEKSSECYFDWLQIHDGRSSADHLIGRFCGDTLDNGQSIQSSGNSLYLWFRSDDSVNQDGFTLHWVSTDPICGETIEATSYGTIKSPGSPGKYPPNRDCYWKLSANPGKRIQIHFFTMQIETHPDCKFDYLAIYDGELTSDPLLVKYCNTTNPPPLLSSGPNLLIYFHSDAFSNDYGFQMSYVVVEGVPGCGGIYTADSGELFSPTVNKKYSNNMVCDYKIKLPAETRMRITFIEFELEDASLCQFDSVSIYDGETEESNLIGKYCGEQLPVPFISSSNNLLLVFRSDWSNAKGGFRIRYELVCHKVLTDSSGIFHSPGYPKSYVSNRKCTFVIERPIGTAIKLSFIDVDIESNSYPSCSYDNIQIYDGENENSTLLGTYCGDTSVMPSALISSFNIMYIEFNSDESVNGRGFKANYSTIELACGGILKSYTGIIAMPNNNKTESNSYENNMNCTWVISAPPGYIIQINWLSFNLETFPNCQNADYVAIYENNTLTEESIRIGLFCGTKIPPSMTSLTNTLTVVFVSDESSTSSGFSLSYIMSDSTKLCDRNYFSSSGSITSPGWPSSYPPRKDCTWIIHVDNGQQITLNFTSFELENYPNCLADYLDIRDGGYEGAAFIGKYCGTTIPRLITSMTNSLYLKFHSDHSKLAAGFHAIWESSSTGCGGVLTSYSGIITSPNYPQQYGDNLECYWKVSVSAGSVIHMHFSTLNLESNCLFDYVQIYDNIDKEINSLGRYCSLKPSMTNSIISSSNHVFIKFRSDFSDGGTGFILNYVAKCDRNITGYNGIIESFNFPNEYPDNIDCHWRIKVPKGNKIAITFSHFELEDMAGMRIASSVKNDELKFIRNNQACIHDYFEIIETLDVTTDSIERYCGKVMPPRYISKKNELVIHFATDQYLTYSGFRLEWNIVGCGGVLRRPTAVISTPDYPKAYAIDTECVWTIIVESGMSVQLNITDHVLDFSENCTTDSLTVYNGEDDSSSQLLKICHENTNGPIVTTSTGNYMYVKFVSNGGFAGKGFMGVYTSVPSKCGGKFVSSIGIITSPNYPSNYDIQMHCFWEINAPDDQRISINFEDFDLATDDEKCLAEVRLYDGMEVNNNSLIVGNLCGNTLENRVYVSNSSKMLVEFISIGFISAKGFKASYSIKCGKRIVTKNEGIILLNRFQMLMGNIDTCVWNIIAENPVDRIALTFIDLSVLVNKKNQTRCSDFKISIFNGESTSAPLIGEYCDNKAPPTIVSDGSALTIKLFNSDTYLQNSFEVHYSILTTTCGGDLKSEHGSFTSPMYPSTYPPKSECVWTFKPSPGNSIALTFLKFNLQASDHCEIDYLEARMGDSTGELIGLFCGTEMPTNITSDKNLWIKFHSYSNDGTYGGFLVDYSYKHGNDLTGESGSIGSPLYPKPFAQRVDGEFYWRISVTFGSFIRITFKEIKIPKYNQECDESNSVIIYDGFDETSPILLTACGYELPESIESSTYNVYIKLASTGGPSGTLFLLEWSRVTVLRNSDGVIIAPETNKNCGNDDITFIPETSSFTLKSPGYPNGYDVNLKCEWIFETEKRNHLNINFMTISMEESDGCVVDGIKVYTTHKHEDNQWNLINSLCLVNESGLEINAGSRLKIVFSSDISNNGSGFEAKITSKCGANFTDNSGELYPIYPNGTKFYFFSKPMICEWSITVRSGRKIKVEITEMNIYNTDPLVCTNYLMLRNGQWMDSPLLGRGKYCDNGAPKDALETIGNRVYIRYSDKKISSQTQSSFKLRYSEISNICDQKLTLTYLDNTTTISSPNYPNIPDPYTECTWVIMAPVGERIRIDFIERFDLTPEPECPTEYVELRDGGTEYSESIGTFCGKIPATQRSSGNVVFIKFLTNKADPKNGFKATVSIDVCGGTVQGFQGVIRMPRNLPMINQRIEVNCEWTIQSPPEFIIKLNIDELEIPDETDCNDHYLQITEINPVNKTESEVSPKICSKSDDPLIFSTNMAKVKLFFKKGTLNNFDSKMKLTYNVTRNECGGNLDTPEGILSRPGYTSTSYFGRFCTWKITVPEGRRISLQILEGFDNMDRFKNSDIRLSIYNDHLFISPIEFNRTNGAIIESSSNKMMVYYWLRFLPFIYIPFKAKYTSDKQSLCQGDFSSMEGFIAHIDVNSSYYCEYNHIMTYNPNPVENNNYNADTQHTLVMTFSDIAIGQTTISPYCSFTSSRIMVTTRGSYAYRQICGNYTEPIMIMSSAQQTIIKIIDKRGDSKYIINYKVNNCGGTYSNVDESFKLKVVPSSSGSVECIWLLRPPTGLKLYPNSINVKLAGTCETEYFNIKWQNSWINKGTTYCGANFSAMAYPMAGNMIIIEYWAKRFYNETKLDFSFPAKGEGCGGILRSKRPFTSPNFPAKYESDEECTWEINEESGFRINLYFETRFAVEKSENCSKDFVEIFDNIDDEWVSMDKLCGREFPHDYNSTSNKMKIVFRSDSNINSDGFKANWRRFCGGKFEATNHPKYLVSPGYPLYSRELRCKYEISVPEGQFVRLTFANFSLERKSPRGKCEYDNVTLESESGYYFSSSEVKVFCGEEVPSAQTFYNGVSIGFNTDKWMQKSGFTIIYMLDVCGGDINTTQTLRSQSEENKFYTADQTCVWNITAPPDKIIILRFRKFIFEKTMSCILDSVSFYDGYEIKDSAMLTKLCGNQTIHLPVVKSKSNKMVVKMETDFSGEYEGFVADIIFADDSCDNTWNINSSKPLKLKIEKDKQYRPFADCHWLIVAPESHVIIVNFESFHIAPCLNVNQTALTRGNCSCDYLEIRDGSGFFSQLIGRFCGHSLPNSVISSSNNLWIRLVSDGTLLSSGVEATITSELGICGEQELEIDDTTKILTSPGYSDGKLLRNIRCKWSFKSDKHLYVHIKILEIDMAPPTLDRRCMDDRLELTNYMNLGPDDGVVSGQMHSFDSEDESNVHTYCGHLNGYEITMFHANTYFILQTAAHVDRDYKGFKLEYGAVACANYTQSSGKILIPEMKGNCISFIIAPVNHTISLYIETTALLDDDSNIKIRDGPNSDSTILSEIRGFASPLPIFSSSNILRLDMFGSEQHSYFGFSSYYLSTDKGRGCGGKTTYAVGVLSSPQYPMPFRIATTCEWIIETSYETRIQIKFSVFDLGGKNATCEFNYVELFDHDDRSIVKFCPGDNPASRESSSNYMRIVNHSNRNNIGIGWLLTYKTVDNKIY